MDVQKFCSKVTTNNYALGFDHISYNFKTGVQDGFEIIYFFYLLRWAKIVPPKKTYAKKDAKKLF